MRARFLSAIEQMRGGVDVERLVMALQAGNVEAALQALPWDVFERLFGEDAQSLLREAAGAGGNRAANDLVRRLDIAYRFDLNNPRAIAWAQTHAARLLRDVTVQTELAVRGLVTRAMKGEFDGQALARRIREIVGLTDRQALAVEHFEQRLISEGVSGDALSRRVERYTKAQLQFRATRLARTELIAASNQGTLESWNEAIEKGYLDVLDTYKQWIITDDERLEERCERLDGVQVRLADPFPGGIMRPPLHPMCRCAVSLVIKRPNEVST